MTTHGRAAAGPRLGVLVPQDRSPRRAAARGSCFSAVQSERGSGLGSAGLPCPARSARAVGPRACHGAGGQRDGTAAPSEGRARGPGRR